MLTPEREKEIRDINEFTTPYPREKKPTTHEHYYTVPDPSTYTEINVFTDSGKTTPTTNLDDRLREINSSIERAVDEAWERFIP